MDDRGDTFRDFVLDQLGEVPELRDRTMFGGHGLYAGRRFFAVLYRERLYFKTNEETRKEYLEAGMDMFRPSEKLALKTYFEVPATVIEDREKLVKWAGRAIACAGLARRPGNDRGPATRGGGRPGPPPP